ncbi:hypothetical protein POM88_008982 [Heracleum sosnowskyi]|uniref:Ubiquitin-like protease family profile domain-containing protein n=1 Tax=Heracleum sosnowskyi TaxID=360622 RepID=A0AAD8J920_9APIA|nr:hypothetical protein POM88_008982 [Heracleum sosnowskyi]
MDIYKNGGNEEFDVAFDMPFEIPKVPQQKDDTKCGQYVLNYIYKFLLACPKYFNIDEDFPGFVKLPALYAHMLSGEESKLNENTALTVTITDGSRKHKGVFNLDREKNRKENEQELAKGENTEFGKKIKSENASLQSPPVFEPFDALRALILYSPDSSQEKQITVPPSFSCENNDTPEAVEEIPKERKNDKENSVTLGRKLKIKVGRGKSSLFNETNDRAVEEETNVEPHVCY